MSELNLVSMEAEVTACADCGGVVQAPLLVQCAGCDRVFDDRCALAAGLPPPGQRWSCQRCQHAQEEGPALDPLVERMLSALEQHSVPGHPLDTRHAAADVGLTRTHLGTLWKMVWQVSSAKLRLLSLAGDAPVAAARLAQHDWRCVQLALTHCSADIMPKEWMRRGLGAPWSLVRSLILLQSLAQGVHLERVKDVAARRKCWKQLHHQYSRCGLVVSCCVLQYRWHWLRLHARKAVQLIATEQHAGLRKLPHDVFLSFARRFPDLITEAPPSWKDIARSGELVNQLPPECAILGSPTAHLYRRKVPDMEAAAPGSDDDLELIERPLETIDLSHDDQVPPDLPCTGTQPMDRPRMMVPKSEPVPDPVKDIPDSLQSVPEHVQSVPEPVQSVPEPIQSLTDMIQRVPVSLHSTRVYRPKRAPHVGLFEDLEPTSYERFSDPFWAPNSANNTDDLTQVKQTITVDRGKVVIPRTGNIQELRPNDGENIDLDLTETSLDDGSNMTLHGMQANAPALATLEVLNKLDPRRVQAEITFSDDDDDDCFPISFNVANATTETTVGTAGTHMTDGNVSVNESDVAEGDKNVESERDSKRDIKPVIDESEIPEDAVVISLGQRRARTSNSINDQGESEQLTVLKDVNSESTNIEKTHNEIINKELEVKKDDKYHNYDESQSNNENTDHPIARLGQPTKVYSRKRKLSTSMDTEQIRKKICIPVVEKLKTETLKKYLTKPNLTKREDIGDNSLMNKDIVNDINATKSTQHVAENHPLILNNKLLVNLLNTDKVISSNQLSEETLKSNECKNYITETKSTQNEAKSYKSILNNRLSVNELNSDTVASSNESNEEIPKTKVCTNDINPTKSTPNVAESDQSILSNELLVNKLKSDKITSSNQLSEETRKTNECTDSKENDTNLIKASETAKIVSNVTETSVKVKDILETVTGCSEGGRNSTQDQEFVDIVKQYVKTMETSKKLKNIMARVIDISDDENEIFNLDQEVSTDLGKNIGHRKHSVEDMKKPTKLKNIIDKVVEKTITECSYTNIQHVLTGLRKPDTIIEEPIQAIEKPVEIVKKPTGDTEKTIEEIVKLIEDMEKPIEGVEKPVVVIATTIDVNKKLIKDVEKPIEIIEKPVEVLLKPIEATEKTNDVTENPIKVKENRIEVVENTVGVMEKTIEVIENTILVAEKPYRDIEKAPEVIENPKKDVEKSTEIVKNSIKVMEKPVEILETSITQTPIKVTEKQPFCKSIASIENRTDSTENSVFSIENRKVSTDMSAVSMGSRTKSMEIEKPAVSIEIYTKSTEIVMPASIEKLTKSAEIERSPESIESRTEFAEKSEVPIENGAKSTETFIAFLESGTTSLEKSQASIESGTKSTEKSTASLESGTESPEKSISSKESGMKSTETFIASLESGTKSTETFIASVENGTTSLERSKASIESDTISTEKSVTSLESGTESPEKSKSSEETSTKSTETFIASLESGAKSTDKFISSVESGAISLEKSKASIENGTKSTEKSTASKESSTKCTETFMASLESGTSLEKSENGTKSTEKSTASKESSTKCTETFMASLESGTSLEKSKASIENGTKSTEKSTASKESSTKCTETFMASLESGTSLEKSKASIENGTKSTEKSTASKESSTKCTETFMASLESGTSLEKSKASIENGTKSTEKSTASKESSTKCTETFMASLESGTSLEKSKASIESETKYTEQFLTSTHSGKKCLGKSKASLKCGTEFTEKYTASLEDDTESTGKSIASESSAEKSIASVEDGTESLEAPTELGEPPSSPEESDHAESVESPVTFVLEEDECMIDPKLLLPCYVPLPRCDDKPLATPPTSTSATHKIIDLEEYEDYEEYTHLPEVSVDDSWDPRSHSSAAIDHLSVKQYLSRGPSSTAVRRPINNITLETSLYLNKPVDDGKSDDEGGLIIDDDVYLSLSDESNDSNQPVSKASDSNRPDCNRPDDLSRPDFNRPHDSNRPVSSRPMSNSLDDPNGSDSNRQVTNKPVSNRPYSNRPDDNSRPNYPNRPNSNRSDDPNRPITPGLLPDYHYLQAIDETQCAGGPLSAAARALLRTCRKLTVDVRRLPNDIVERLNCNGVGRVKPRVSLPDIAEVRRVNRRIATAQVRPITTIHSPENEKAAGGGGDEAGEAEGGRISLSALREVLQLLPDNQSISEAHQAATRPPKTRYCCPARRHAVINAAKQRMHKGRKMEELHIHKCPPQECTCCCDPLALQGERRELSRAQDELSKFLAQVHAQHISTDKSSESSNDEYQPPPKKAASAKPKPQPRRKSTKKSKPKTHQSPAPDDYAEWIRQRNLNVKYFEFPPSSTKTGPNLTSIESSKNTHRNYLCFTSGNVVGETSRSIDSSNAPRATPGHSVAVTSRGSLKSLLVSSGNSGGEASLNSSKSLRSTPGYSVLETSRGIDSSNAPRVTSGNSVRETSRNSLKSLLITSGNSGGETSQRSIESSNAPRVTSGNYAGESSQSIDTSNSHRVNSRGFPGEFARNINSPNLLRALSGNSVGNSSRSLLINSPSSLVRATSENPSEPSRTAIDSPRRLSDSVTPPESTRMSLKVVKNQTATGKIVLVLKRKKRKDVHNDKNEHYTRGAHSDENTHPNRRESVDVDVIKVNSNDASKIERPHLLVKSVEKVNEPYVKACEKNYSANIVSSEPSPRDPTGSNMLRVALTRDQVHNLTMGCPVTAGEHGTAAGKGKAVKETIVTVKKNSATDDIKFNKSKAVTIVSQNNFSGGTVIQSATVSQSPVKQLTKQPPKDQTKTIDLSYDTGIVKVEPHEIKVEPFNGNQPTSQNINALKTEIDARQGDKQTKASDNQTNTNRDQTVNKLKQPMTVVQQLENKLKHMTTQECKLSDDNDLVMDIDDCSNSDFAISLTDDTEPTPEDQLKKTLTHDVQSSPRLKCASSRYVKISKQHPTTTTKKLCFILEKDRTVFKQNSSGDATVDKLSKLTGRVVKRVDLQVLGTRNLSPSGTSDDLLKRAKSGFKVVRDLLSDSLQKNQSQASTAANQSYKTNLKGLLQASTSNQLRKPSQSNQSQSSTLKHLLDPSNQSNHSQTIIVNHPHKTPNQSDPARKQNAEQSNIDTETRTRAIECLNALKNKRAKRRRDKELTSKEKTEKCGNYLTLNYCDNQLYMSTSAGTAPPPPLVRQGVQPLESGEMSQTDSSRDESKVKVIKSGNVSQLSRARRVGSGKESQLSQARPAGSGNVSQLSQARRVRLGKVSQPSQARRVRLGNVSQPSQARPVGSGNVSQLSQVRPAGSADVSQVGLVSEMSQVRLVGDVSQPVMSMSGDMSALGMASPQNNMMFVVNNTVSGVQLTHQQQQEQPNNFGNMLMVPVAGASGQQLYVLRAVGGAGQPLASAPAPFALTPANTTQGMALQISSAVQPGVPPIGSGQATVPGPPPLCRMPPWVRKPEEGSPQEPAPILITSVQSLAAATNVGDDPSDETTTPHTPPKQLRIAPSPLTEAKMPLSRDPSAAILRDCAALPPILAWQWLAGRDPTNLCVCRLYQDKPLLQLPPHFIVVTATNQVGNDPWYWALSKRERPRRLLWEQHGDTFGAPDLVTTDDKLYKKMSDEPVLYAQVVTALWSVAQCRALLLGAAPLAILCVRSGRLLPVDREAGAGGDVGMRCQLTRPLAHLVQRLNEMPEPLVEDKPRRRSKGNTKPGTSGPSPVKPVVQGPLDEVIDLSD